MPGKILLLAFALSFVPWQRALSPREDARVHASAGVAATMPIVDRLDPALDTLLARGVELLQFAGGYKWTEGTV